MLRRVLHHVNAGVQFKILDARQLIGVPVGADAFFLRLNFRLLDQCANRCDARILFAAIQVGVVGFERQTVGGAAFREKSGVLIRPVGVNIEHAAEQATVRVGKDALIEFVEFGLAAGCLAAHRGIGQALRPVAHHLKVVALSAHEEAA